MFLHSQASAAAALLYNEHFTVTHTLAKECVIEAGTAMGNISLGQYIWLKFSFHERSQSHGLAS